MVGETINMLERWFAPWKRRILSMVGKCILSAIDDSGGLQTVDLSFLKDETIDNIERVQEYGFTSHPPKDSEGVVAFLGGNQQHGVVIATDSSKYRIKPLPEGAVAIYNMNGDFVKLESDKMTVEVAEEYHEAPTKVVVNSPKVVLGTSLENPLNGVVTGQCVCSLTGAVHPDVSQKVQAAKL
jgi:phage baseplate assembly protein V